ncbi:K(+) efflux antiporter 3, chloroplastic-like [Gastrolobium bilobum]|uniref:K(+) efflux antiporter 3, chloroplastic-like n=1 Tax=Gastrolobium bilobum TaxID=150636 RepID=UPI002AB184F2|nr:K(+) efflux antiporter 3, chloroplastic-like [Gastrolobium bilobum]
MFESLAYSQSFKGYDLTKQKSPGCSHAVSRIHRNFICMFYSDKLSHDFSHRISHKNCISEGFFESKPLIVPSISSWKGFYFSKCRPLHWERMQTSATHDVAGAVEVINDLGLDTLTFLAVTVLIVPTFKLIKASPILGFFFAGVVLNQFGLIRNLTDVKVLSEWGILFLLFEMGLELSFARLKALAKFSFGMGLTQVVLSTLAFTAFELPPNGAIGTKILEVLFHSRPDLVNIRSIDEAVVIAAALSLSSSAFVLQLLAEKGELPTRFGSATLGILLLQDIAVVPLLVILPVLESQNLAEGSIWPMLALESLKALGGLGLLSLGGKYILRRVFEVVADARSSEAFVALCLLTIAGTSLVTQNLGFSDTLGAFLAGSLLAETNFRTQIEADIRPFKGLLLGLFFLTTGTSIDMQLLLREWPNVLSLLAGLIAIKTLIITAIGPCVGLTLQESVRIGLLLSQGGEFGFVVFSLANRLGVLPLELNKLLIIVVVLSMVLTPFLNEAGRRAAGFIDDKFDAEIKASDMVNFSASEPVVIIGFGQMGQVLANFLSNPLASGDSDAVGWPYVAFDLDPTVVKAATKVGFPIRYGDGSRPAVLQSAGISSPKAIMVMYAGKKKTVEAVQRLRFTFPAVPIYARAKDLEHLLDLKKAGATDAILENAETSLLLGSKLLKGLGMMSDDVAFLSQLIRDSMELQAQQAVSQSEYHESDMMKPLQVRVGNLTEAHVPMATTSHESELSESNQADHASVPRIQMEVEQDYELNQAVNFEEHSVLCRKQGTEESSLLGSQDALGEKNLVDPTIPCRNAIEEP